MDWLQQLDYFRPLKREDVEMFAPPRESDAVISAYNQALDMLRENHLDKGYNMLKRITEDYPMFSQASHLYGVVAAIREEYKTADEYLKRVELLDIQDDTKEVVLRQRKALRIELRKMRRQLDKEKRQKEILKPIQEDMAMASILEKASSWRGKLGKDWTLATEKEAEEILAAQKQNYQADLFGEEEAEERRKTRTVALLSVVIGAVILLVFFTIIRPLILKKQTVDESRDKQLEWLEKEIQSQAESNEAISDLWQRYQTWLEQND